MDLKAERDRLGLTENEMADACGVPYNTYYRWETGRRALPSVAHQLVLILGWLHDRNLLGRALRNADKKANR